MEMRSKGRRSLRVSISGPADLKDQFSSIWIGRMFACRIDRFVLFETMYNFVVRI